MAVRTRLGQDRTAFDNLEVGYCDVEAQHLVPVILEGIACIPGRSLSSSGAGIEQAAGYFGDGVMLELRRDLEVSVGFVKSRVEERNLIAVDRTRKYSAAGVKAVVWEVRGRQDIDLEWVVGCWRAGC